MARHGRPAFVLALLVALSGCTAFGLDPGSPAPTPTATPVWPDPLPPGVNATAVVHPLELVRAHAVALTGRSFTYRETIVVRTPDGIRLGAVHTVRRVAADGRFVHRTRVEGVVPSVVSNVRAVDAYSNGSVVVIRFRQDGQNTTLVTSAAESPIAATDVVRRGIIYSMVAVTDPAVVGPLTRGGTTYLHVRGVNGTTTLGFVEATNATFEALVAPSGLVHRYALRYRANDTSYTGWEGRIERRVAFEDVGSTAVYRPDWVAEAIPNATQVPTGR